MKKYIFTLFLVLFLTIANNIFAAKLSYAEQLKLYKRYKVNFEKVIKIEQSKNVIDQAKIGKMNRNIQKCNLYISKIEKLLKINNASSSIATSSIQVSEKKDNYCGVLSPFDKKDSGYAFFDNLDCKAKVVIKFRSDILDAVRESDKIMNQWSSIVHILFNTDKNELFKLSNDVQDASAQALNDLRKIQIYENIIEKEDYQSLKGSLNDMQQGMQYRISRMDNIVKGVKQDKLDLVNKANNDGAKEAEYISKGMLTIIDVMKKYGVTIQNDAYINLKDMKI